MVVKTLLERKHRVVLEIAETLSERKGGAVGKTFLEKCLSGGNNFVKEKGGGGGKKFV